MENIDIETIDIVALRQQGLSWSSISRETGISRKKIAKYVKSKDDYEEPFLKITDTDAVRELIRPVIQNQPNVGELVLRGHLQSCGFKVARRLLRISMELEDPGGRERRTQRTSIARVPYDAHGPGYLWHTDTYHKLGLVAGIVISGTIDGFTREVVALDAYTSNTASNVLNSIVTAFTRKGIPRLLRADAGSENIAIGKFMYLVRGEDSFLIGKSVNNQRIERFWRDLRNSVMETYIQFFKSLGPVRVQPEVIWVIQYLFLPRIQLQMESFRKAWNHHPIRTEHMLSPRQLNLAGTRAYYKPYDQNDENIQFALTPLRQEYEGRPTSRGTCPFTTEEAKAIFSGSITPLDIEDLPVTWQARLDEALQEARRLQEWEEQF